MKFLKILFKVGDFRLKAIFSWGISIELFIYLFRMIAPEFGKNSYEPFLTFLVKPIFYLVVNIFHVDEPIYYLLILYVIYLGFLACFVLAAFNAINFILNEKINSIKNNKKGVQSATEHEKG